MLITIAWAIALMTVAWGFGMAVLGGDLWAGFVFCSDLFGLGIASLLTAKALRLVIPGIQRKLLFLTGFVWGLALFITGFMSSGLLPGEENFGVLAGLIGALGGILGGWWTSICLRTAIPTIKRRHVLSISVYWAFFLAIGWSITLQFGLVLKQEHGKPYVYSNLTVKEEDELKSSNQDYRKREFVFRPEVIFGSFYWAIGGVIIGAMVGVTSGGTILTMIKARQRQA